jgi:hypothetical protein
VSAKKVISKRETRLRAERDALIKTLPTRSPIYLPTEKIDLEAQIVGLGNVRDIYADMERVYGPKIRALRDKYKGRDRAFIIGNGPSLNETDLSSLRDEVTFCVNGFFLKMPELDWTPTFYLVEDHLVAEDRADAINAFKGPTKLFPAYLGYCLDKGDDTIFYNHRPRVSYPHGFDFSTEADKITYTGCTVTFSCLQLAHYMGFREIYLIGVDASYAIPDDAKESAEYGTGVIDMKSDDVNHFHPDYFGKGFRWHDPQVNKMVEAYEEAERETQKLGRPIYNATIGGMLEVFERRNFLDIFPDAISPETYRAIGAETSPEDRAKQVRELVKNRQSVTPDTAHSPFPKVAVIDMTRMGHATATGELKATLLGQHPKARLMQVFSTGHSIGIDAPFMPGADGNQRLMDIKRALDWIIDFNPDVILFRPTPEKPNLTALADLAYKHTGARFVTWIMDGWQDRLLLTDAKAGAAAEEMLSSWFKRSHHCLAISDQMAAAYSERYGRPFTAIANAVDARDWVGSRPVKSDDSLFVLRYSGGLAPDMSLDTLTNIATAVESLAKKHPIRFEINTRSHWLATEGAAFDQFEHTHLSCNEMDIASYREWIAGGDASLITYNFDEKTITYVQHSMANKLPECLASGSPLIAIGPKELATIAYLKDHKLGVVIDKPGVVPIKTVLRKLMGSRDLQTRLSEQGRDFVFKNRSLDLTRDQLLAVLSDAAKDSVRSFTSRPSRRRKRYITEIEKLARVRAVPTPAPVKVLAKKAASAPAKVLVETPTPTPTPASLQVPKPAPIPTPAPVTIPDPVVVKAPVTTKATAAVKTSPPSDPVKVETVSSPAKPSEEESEAPTPKALVNKENQQKAAVAVAPATPEPVAQIAKPEPVPVQVVKKRVTPPRYHQPVERVTARHIIRFYSGSKGLVVLVLLALAAAPALPLSGWMKTVANLGPAAAMALLLLLVARWVIQLTHAFENR